MRLQYKDIARDGNGIIISNANIAVYLGGTTTAANVYTSSTSTTAVNSVTSGSDGSFVFYVDAIEYGSDQTYKIVLTATINGIDLNSYTIDNITIEDAVLGNYTISTARTASYPVRIPKGVVYVKSGSGTLTFNESFEAGHYQVFSGFSSGDVSFLAGKVDEVFPEWWGAKGDGTTDDTTALANAIAAGVSGATTIIGARTYIFSSTLTVGTLQQIKGKGQYMSVLKKTATFSGAGIRISGNAAGLSDFLVSGDTGNAGDGVAIEAARVSIRNFAAVFQGGNGIRIGKDSGLTSANGWLLDNVDTNANTGHGLYIHDGTGGGPNVNAGVAISLQSVSNTGDGIRIGTAMLNTFIGALSEGNAGWGVNISPPSAFNGYNWFNGGDIEANTTGQVLIGAGATKNGISFGNVNAPVVNNGGNNYIFSLSTPSNSYTPVVSGSTAAGTATYVTQQGRYTSDGRIVHVWAYAEWTGHTGTGDLQMSIPVTSGANSPTLVIGSVVANNLTYTAGASLSVYISQSSDILKIAASATGSPSAAVAIAAAGGMYVYVTYEINN